MLASNQSGNLPSLDFTSSVLFAFKERRQQPFVSELNQYLPQLARQIDAPALLALGGCMLASHVVVVDQNVTVSVSFIGAELNIAPAQRNEFPPP